MEPEITREETAAEKYLRQRDACRRKATNDFLSQRPRTNLIVATTNELVASLIFFLVDKDMAGLANGKYIVDLLVSFCRSHFVAMDFILQGEIIESAVIFRKQMELLSRLKELCSGLDVSKLIDETPNVKQLRAPIRRLYGEYSAIAHSSKPDKLRLLGTVTKNGLRFAPLYPVFDDSMYVALNHTVLLTVDFAIWAREFFRRELKPYEGAYDEALLENLVKLVTAESSDLAEG